MISVSSREIQRQWGRVKGMALVKPVAITSKGRNRLVILSWEEYRRLKRRDRQILLPLDFTDADVVDLENTRAPEDARIFDFEVIPANSQ